MKTASDRIAQFWRWFSEHRRELGAPDISSRLVAELEEHLFAVERLDWEIGPGSQSANLFALSPRGDPALLQLTRRMVASAPSLSGWEFWPAKPPRTWDLVFNLAADESEVEIDAKLWEFVAYKFPDGTYDLVFKPDDP